MSNKSFIFSIIIFTVTILAVVGISLRGEPVVIATNLENLPMEIADFKATEDSFPESVYEELNADKHIYRHYRSKEGTQVDLYIGYYGTAKGGRTPHNPYACLSGAGWGIIKTNKVTLKMKYYKSGVNINYILSQKGQQYEAILHWYQSDGTKILDSGIKQNIQRFIGKTLYNKNDGAFVRVSIYTHKEDIHEANSIIVTFAEKVLGLLPQYWPVEK